MNPTTDDGRPTTVDEPGVGHNESGRSFGRRSLRSAQGRLVVRRRWFEPLAVTLFFSLLSVAMTWPLVLYLGSGINVVGDVALQMAVMRWDAHALTTNPLGLMEAPFLYPYAHSVTFSEHLVGETLLALPFLIVTGNPGLAYNINLLVSFALTGIFTYLLVRDLTGSRAAGIFAGVAFAFCPFRFMQVSHLHMLATPAFPLTLWALFRMLRHMDDNRPAPPPWRWLVLAGVGVVAMGLTSVYFTMFLAVALLLFGAWWAVRALWQRRGLPPVRVMATALVRFAVVGIAVAAVLLPIYIPYQQTSSDLGIVRTTYEVRNWSAHLSYYGKVPPGNWLYGEVLAPGMTGTAGERQLFFGIVPGLLALVGLALGRGRGKIYFVLLGALAFLMTFGLSVRLPSTGVEVPLPYAFFYDWLPGFKALRVPVRFSVLVDFAVYVLAGYGIAALRRRTTDDRRPETADGVSVGWRAVVGRRSSVVAALAAILVLLEFAHPLDLSDRRDIGAEIQANTLNGWLARPENAGPVLELPMNPDQEDVDYMLFGTRHFQPLVNGWSGFVPPGTIYLSRALATFPDALTVSMLQGMEVRHVVVHLWRYSKDRQPTLKQRLSGTQGLSLVHQEGEDYVYELAPDPWVRRLAESVGRDKYVWIGEPRHGDMPTLEVAAYMLEKMGVPREHIVGNMSVGYRPLASLPFGTYPDYALVPDILDMDDARLLPLGVEQTERVLANHAVRILRLPDAATLRGYDFTAPNAPRINPENVEMTVRGTGLQFAGGPDVKGDDAAGQRALDFYFLTFEPSVFDMERKAGTTPYTVPVGMWRMSLDAGQNERVRLLRKAGDARILSATSHPAAGDPSYVEVEEVLDYLAVVASPTGAIEGGNTVGATVRVLGPPNTQYTGTIDVYVEPWGTHPSGHFGSWSVVVSGGEPHSYTFELNALSKMVTTTQDGAPVETYAWVGDPTEGDFKASFLLTDKAGATVANIPLGIFTLTEGRLTGWQPTSPGPAIIPLH